MLKRHRARISALCFVWVVPILLAVAPAWAGERVALVIGNAAYAHAPALATPVNDAADIGTALERLGFAVTRVENADQATLLGSLRSFASAAVGSKMAVVFYAGHGVAVNERNFLVPVDARLASQEDVDFEAVPLGLVERAVARASDVRLVILDACRENPFAASLGQGLAPAGPAAGMLVAYAAKEGTVAPEAQGRNSPYAEALLRHLEEPGLEVGLVFGRVREAVLTATGGGQEPVTYGSLTGESVTLAIQPASSEDDPAPAAPAEGESGADQLTAEMLAAERLYWASVKDSDDPAEIQTYLDQYPDGLFAALARTRLKRLGGAAAPEATEADAPPEVAAQAEAQGGVETPPVPEEPEPSLEPEAVEEALGLQRDHRRLIQSGLAQLGFDPGPADGVFGQRTRAAIGAWQESVDKPATGYLDAEGAKKLAKEGHAAAPPPGKRAEEAVKAAMDTLSKALRAAGEIEDHGDRARALARIGEILAKAGDERRAAKIFDLAVAAAEREASDYDRSNALKEIVAAQAEAGDAQGAAQTIARALADAQRRSDAYDRALALTSIATAQAEVGDTGSAKQTLARALASAEQITYDTPRDHALGGIAEAQARAGDIRGALATTQGINKENRQGAFALASIAGAQAKAGDIRGALATTQGINEKSWHGHALFSIAEAQAKAGNIRGALATAERIADTSWHGAVFFRIAEAQAQGGDIQGALATAQRIEDGEERATKVFSWIAEAQAKASDAEGAARSIERALATAERIADASSRAWALANIAEAQAKASDAEGAARSIERALATAERIADASSRAWALGRIAEAQAKAGDIRGALATAQRIEDEEIRAGALINIAEAQLESGTR